MPCHRGPVRRALLLAVVVRSLQRLVCLAADASTRIASIRVPLDFYLLTHVHDVSNPLLTLVLPSRCPRNPNQRCVPDPRIHPPPTVPSARPPREPRPRPQRAPSQRPRAALSAPSPPTCSSARTGENGSSLKTQTLGLVCPTILVYPLPDHTLRRGRQAPRCQVERARRRREKGSLCISLFVMSTNPPPQPYIEMATKDKARAEEEKASLSAVRAPFRMSSDPAERITVTAQTKQGKRRGTRRRRRRVTAA